MIRRVALLVLFGFAACDGDGCNAGPASKFCQGEAARLTIDPARAAAHCKSCCLQEVPYEGRIENGLCVCR